MAGEAGEAGRGRGGGKLRLVVDPRQLPSAGPSWYTSGVPGRAVGEGWTAEVSSIPGSPVPVFKMHLYSQERCPSLPTAAPHCPPGLRALGQPSGGHGRSLPSVLQLEMPDKPRRAGTCPPPPGMALPGPRCRQHVCGPQVT